MAAIMNKNRLRAEQDEKELEELVKAPESEEEKSQETELKPAEEKPLNREEESFKKRYGDLRRHMQEKEKEWQDRFEALEARMKNDMIAPPKSDEDIEQWVKKHPDVAAIVKALAAKEADAKFKLTEDRLKELDEARYEATRTKAEQEIRKAHPDFDDLRAADDFHDWAEEQPKWVQDALYVNSDDPKSVIRVIDLYKVDKGLTKQDRKAKEKEAAGIVKPNTKASVQIDDSQSYLKESQVAKMSDKEYEKRQDEIMEAMRSGKFIYDLSGGAR